MKEPPKNETRMRSRASLGKLALLAAIIAVVQGCFTIEGRGIDGFLIGVSVFFVGYLLLFLFLRWLLGRFPLRRE